MEGGSGVGGGTAGVKECIRKSEIRKVEFLAAGEARVAIS